MGPDDSLGWELDRAFALLREAQQAATDLSLREVGRVIAVAGGLAWVEGIPGVGLDELVMFPGDQLGQAMELAPEQVGVALLGSGSGLSAGTEVKRTGRVADVPVGPPVLGRVLDPLGRPLDGGPAISNAERWPIEYDAPAIIDRAPVAEPMETGVKVVDALIPIGWGQRELVLGDRQTGKSSLALDAILNQPDEVASVYCAIGQRGSAVARFVAALRSRGALARTVVVVAGGEESPGLRYVAPFAATSIAESFMRAGRRALVVYDDLTSHARAYRELSLLLRRPPGREAYPGDLFYLHARLLERATHLRPEAGGGAMTALPIVETEAGNIAAYLSTNLISITDGQIVLSPDLFQRGVLPAVDVALSVSRVGGEAQLPAYRAIIGDLKLAFAQFEELELFSRFGARLDPESQRRLTHGQRVREGLKQPAGQPVPVPEQLVLLDALSRGGFDAVPAPRVPAAERAVRASVWTLPDPVRTGLLDPKRVEPEAVRAMRDAADQAISAFREEP